MNLFQKRFFLFVIGILTGHTLAPSDVLAQEKFRGQLELFVELQAQDSVVALTRIGTNVLEIEWKSAGDSTNRRLRQSIPPAILEKLLTRARQTEVRVETRMAEGSIAAELETPGSLSAQKKNRLKYILSQSIFSSVTYGPALINALNLDGKAAIATPFFTITGSIVGHSIYGINHSFEDAHITSLMYSAMTSGASSYLLGILALGTDDGIRLGSGLLLGAYPFSLWVGYQHADAYVNDPGRVGLEPAFAWTFGLAGYFLTGLYFGNDFSGNKNGTPFRIAAGQALAFGGTGHFISHLYRKGERIPGGIPLGIAAHTLIGTMAGYSLVTSLGLEDDTRPIVSLILGSAVAGFGEALWFFHNNRDNSDRAVFSLLGMAGGAAFAGGILALASDNGSAAGFAWTMTGGIAAGYALTYVLLHNQVEKTVFRTEIRGDLARRVELNLLPIPEARKTADGKWAMGYRIPGLTLRF